MTTTKTRRPARTTSASAERPLDRLHQQVTDRLVAMLEAGEHGTWSAPWHTAAGAQLAGLPFNATTGKAYQGGNILALWVAELDAGYDGSKGWATYNQWSEAGAQVRKGERGTTIVKWVPVKGKDADGQPAEDGKTKMFPKVYSVFHAAQVDGLPEAPAAPAGEPEAPRTPEAAEVWLRSVGADVREGGARAFYSPAGDYIGMPAFEAFTSAEAHAATLGHELVHWTGHASRCDRDLAGRFGSDSYAAEELVAELGAAFLCGRLGLANEPRADHAAYLASWLRVLKADPAALWTAATLAQRAVDHLVAQADKA